MSRMNRRRWSQNLASIFVAGRIAPSNATLPSKAAELASNQLHLTDFEPRSMLHVPERKVPRARYPVIDVHTHLSGEAKQMQGVGVGEAMRYPAEPDAVLPLMDRKNIRFMVNLTGGVGKGLEEAIEKFQRPYPNRFVTFTEPWRERTNETGYPQFQGDQIARAHHAGARQP